MGQCTAVINSAAHLPQWTRLCVTENTEIAALLLHKCFLSVLIRETWGEHRQEQQLYWVMSYEFVCVRWHCGKEPMAHSESVSAIYSHSNRGHKIGCFIMNLRCSRRVRQWVIERTSGRVIHHNWLNGYCDSYPSENENWNVSTLVWYSLVG